MTAATHARMPLSTEGLKVHTEPPMHAAQAAIRQMGFNYGIQQDAAPAPVATPQACRSSFGAWCLDRSSLGKGAIIGIIAGGSAAILAGIVLALYLAVRRRKSSQVQPQSQYMVRGYPMQK